LEGKAPVVRLCRAVSRDAVNAPSTPVGGAKACLKSLYSLKIFGGAVLEEDGQPVTGGAARRHPLAMLAIIAMAKSRPVRREALISLLWPGASASVGRNRLTSTLYLLRKRFGPAVVLSTGDGVQLDPGKISCDVWQFLQAIEADEPQQAAGVYAGPLLDGFYLDDSVPFEEWARDQRQKLHGVWRDAAIACANSAASEGKHKDAARWWRQLANDDPLDSAIARNRVEALIATRNTKEAVDVAEAHAARLHREIGQDAEMLFRQSIADLDIDKGSKPNTRGDDAGNGIAVLPFETLASSDERILAECVHSGVLTRLSAVDGVGVIANTSLRRFLDTSSHMSDIASGLGVRWVVEGDVQTIGDRVRVGVRLIDASLERQTWGHEYVTELQAKEFFDVLASIAGAIVDELKVELSVQAASSIGKRPTESLEAYRRSIRGRLRLDMRGPDDMQASLQHFEKAVEVDPGFALGWIGIADAIGLAHAYGYTDASGLPQAEAAIHKALECDPDCAEAHAALGRLFGQRCQSTAALGEIRKAVALKPGYAEGFAWMTIGLHIYGKVGEAIKSSQRAVRLNPLSAEALNNLCSSYLFAGRYEDAIRTAAEAQDLDEDYDSAQLFGAIAHYESGNVQDALAVLEMLSVPWVGSGVSAVTAVCYVEAGQPARAREQLETIRAAGDLFNEGLVLAALGEYEAAEAALDQAIFDGIDLANSYWPMLCVRYLFKRVWDAMPDPGCRERMLAKVEEVCRR
jgi:DNA-binding SARP family transcriptional activator